MTRIIDLRSDTVTLPTEEMRQAMLQCEVGDDVLGEDPTLNKLEAEAAELLGKEAALFVPSGTFGNQCALLTHTKSGDEVVLCEDCHIVQHEAGAAALLSRVQLRAIAPQNRKHLTLAEVLPRLRLGQDIHYPRTGLICLEQATATGNLYPIKDMREIYAFARDHGIPVHIDGARIFNAAVALGVEAAELAALSDSLSFCLSKGLCAPVGSLLVGTKDFIERARKNRKILGGGMRQAGFLAAAGSVSLNTMRHRLHEDHDNARLLTELLTRFDGVSSSRETQINMVFVNINAKCDEAELLHRLREAGILTYAPEGGEWRFVTHHGITEGDIRQTVSVIGNVLAGQREIK